MANIIRKEGGRDIAPAQGAWDPMTALRELMAWDPLGDRAPGARLGMPAAFAPRFDVSETGKGYLLRADLPGVAEDAVDITLTGNWLTISGHREHEHRSEGETYLAYERSSGSFSRSFSLPDGIDADRITADLKDGVLTVEVPRHQEHQPRKISLRGMVERVKDALGVDQKDKPSA